MSGREVILEKIRQKLIRYDDNARRQTVQNRLLAPPKGAIPARSRKLGTELINLFCEKVEAAQATLTKLDTCKELPRAIETYLQARSLPGTIHMGEDRFLRRLDWTTSANLEIEEELCGPDALTGLSRAIMAVAETGTLVLVSGIDNPTMMNFLPETHMVALSASDIIGDYETAWDMILTQYGKGRLPRVVNMITGPSRSGDIEQTIVLGAHGPRTLQIFLIDQAWE